MLYTFFFSVIASIALTLLVKKIAQVLKIQDFPDATRKKHGCAVPLLGGLAPFMAFFSTIFFLFYFKILSLPFERPILILLISSGILMLGGFLDDKFSLPPKWQIIFPLIAILIAVLGGIRIRFITNPFGGILGLGIFASLGLSFLWLFIISYTTKILDGLDGLVAGITSLAAFTIFLFATFSRFREPGVAHIALALAGVFIGFLIFNIHPAKIFLGEGGSLFSGFILGGLAILTGAKIAVTLMVLALPLIDLGAVIIKRTLAKKLIWKGDRSHLHFILVDKGWKTRNVVFLFWTLSGLLGLAAVFLPSIWKIMALILVIVIFFFVDVVKFKMN